MSGLYSIGLSGLQSSTARITTTGQNTSNVDTEGYSRKSTSTVSVSNGGVRIQDTSRMVNHYINQQVRSDTSNYHYYESYRAQMASFDATIGDNSVSISSYLDKAFSSLQTANSDPTNSASRVKAYADFKELVSQYNDLADYVDTQQGFAKNELETNFASVNGLVGQIAKLNDEIFKQESATGQSALDLRDNQEQLAKELSEYLDVKVSYDDKQLMTVNLSSGQPLVLQGNSHDLRLTYNSSDPDQALGVELDFGRYEIAVSSEDIGGSIGGLMAFRNEFVTTAERTLGQQALVLADTMNQQNHLGLDANNGYGINLFSTGSISVSSNPDNSDEQSTINVRLTAGASDEVSIDTYEMVMTSATEFKLVTYDNQGRTRDESAVIDTSTATPNADGYFEVDGFGVEVSLDALSSYASGDRFQFVPTKTAASQLKLTARSGDDFALAAPINVSSSSTNLSEASISISAVTDTNYTSSAFDQSGGLYPSAPQELYFTADDEVEIRDSVGTVLATLTGITDYSNLLEQAGLADDAGYDVSLDGAPIAGDSFSIGFNDSGESDNYNGLKLANLQTASTVGGVQSYSDAFSSLVTEVGSLAASLQLNKNAAEVVMNKSVAARDEISGVSLDEEAVNLLRFQQSYTAAAQIITAAQSTFATLIGALR